MSSTQENALLEHDIVIGFPQDDHDILDEFLDQRVYDSLSGNQTLIDNYYDENGHIPMDSSEPRYHGDDEMSSSFNVQSAIQTPKENSYLYLDRYRNSEYTTPREDASFSRSPVSNMMQSSKSSERKSSFTDYQEIRNELSKLKFGNVDMNPSPQSVNVPDPSYLDFSPEAMSKMQYDLKLSSLPSYSRVETQVKLKFSLSPPPVQSLLHIPQDLISKNKFSLASPVSNLPSILKENLLYLDAYVLTSNFSKSCNICSRCIKREQKRASRRKNGQNGEADCSREQSNGSMKNSSTWADEDMMKKAIIFNSKEIVSFPPPNGLNRDSNKSLDLSARIICYCRHHNESEGFKLLFIIKDASGEVVAKQISSSIMIMDRKKNSSGQSQGRQDSEIHNKSSETSETKNLLDTDYGLSNSVHPLSPNSIDESMSENQTNTDTDGRGFKKKKLSIDDSLNAHTNPMFNGSVSGLSPMSNSDTNTSAATNMLGKPAGGLIPNVMGVSPLTQPTSDHNMPTIQRVIPAQGPLRGGIDVTLLGYNFRPGLQVKFGANLALSTHCWSDSTIVTYLPPASQPGQVLVSLENLENGMTPIQQQIFTYTDDTDKQLIELALQIVGLKMNGKLEEAKSIARRIVGTDPNSQSDQVSGSSSVHGSSADKSEIIPMNESNKEWFNSAHKAVAQLTTTVNGTEDILIDFLSLVDLPNCPIIIPNWQLCNEQGQTLLHLATMKNYQHLIGFLIDHGSKIDCKDNQGLTPFFMASLCGHRSLMKTFVECKTSWNLKLSNDKHIKDYCDSNVLDIFNTLEENSENELNSPKSESEENDEKMPRSVSLDSLDSLFTLSYGRRISRMVLSEKMDITNSDKRNQANDESFYHNSTEYPSDFADSEFDSNEDEGSEDEPDSDVHSDFSSDERQNGVSKDIDVENNVQPTRSEDASTKSLWSKVKDAFNNDSDSQLPTYEDLFPFGPSSFDSKPKTAVERRLNEQHNEQQPVFTSSSSETGCFPHEDGGVSSDSSEDMVISYLNHPRKKVENDKMLLFFWFPALICVVGLFLYISVMGYKVQFVEDFKNFMRTTLGNLMVGNERLAKVFKKTPNVDQVIRNTGMST